MAEVFISYSSQDSLKANKVREKLETAKISCWISERDILPGHDYAVEIPKAIAECKYFLLLLSKVSQESPYVMLELDQAFKQKKVIIPLLLEPIEQSEKLNFFINAKQHVDGSNDLGGAIMDVILRIRPNHDPVTDVKSTTEMPSHTNSGRYIRCPHCGGTALKRKYYYVDRYFEYCTSASPKEDILFWIRKRRDSLFAPMLAVLELFLGVGLIGYGLFGNEGTVHALPIISALIPVCDCLLCFVMNMECDNVENILINTIHNSNMKYWTFRCGACENDFSVLVPKDDTLSQRVEILLKKTNKEDKTPK